MHDFFATSHCKGPVDAIGGTMKRLVSLEVMSGKAEVITSSEFSLVTDVQEKYQYSVLKNQQNLG